MDGKVIIGMDLDTKELEKKLKESQKLLIGYEKEQEKLTKQRDAVQIETDEALQKVEELQKGIDALIEKRDKLLKGGASESSFSVQMLTEQITSGYEQMTAILEPVNNKYEEINRQIEQNAINQQKVTEEIDRTQRKLSQAKGFKSLGDNLKSIGKTIDKNVKLVGKWALGFIGIRAGVNALRSAYSTIAQYDKQMSTDMEYLRYALAMSVKPIIEWIIKAFYQLLALFGYFIKQITGKNIFEKAGAKQFKKDLEGANKSAKDLNKQLAGFDEANVLSDNKKQGVGTPSQDLAGMVEGMKPEDVDKLWEEVEKGINDARKSLNDYQKEIHETLNNKEAFNKAYGVWATFVHGIGTIWEGLVDVVAGVWDTLVSVWNMFMDVITGDWDKLGEDFKLFINGTIEFFVGFGETIYGIFETLAGLIIGILGELLKWIWNIFIKPLVDGFKNGWNEIKQEAVENWENIKQSVIDFWDSAKEIPKKMKNTFRDVANYIKNVFVSLFESITNGFSKVSTFVFNLGASFRTGVKSVINFFIDGINKMIRGMNKIQWDVPDWVPFIGGQKWGVNISEIPRLASGGIVNMPSKGVMVGNAIAGESGREGVIPLTDPNAMAQLGREIGQWVNLAIDNRMVVDGRVLATATNNQINKESFLMNR